MKLIEKIQADMTAAMKAREEFRLGVLRMVKSALKNKEIEKIRPLEEAEEFGILQTLVKQRHEAAEQFTKGGRNELAEKELREIPIIEAYLPQAAAPAEMDAAITAAIAETGASSAKQMGAVIKAARTRLGGKTIDGKALSDLVRARLGG
ncbi:MAG TPA: GatB/YqeY domain-containing protein [Candidatus Acidoferrales bacterium]|nr:GatB/YqeY domain-containing protein [Candidatus Acidoferrales bacterium]